MMNGELAQIVALITYGNEYLTSLRYDVPELFPTHSTFQYVSEVSFCKLKIPQDILSQSRIVAKDSRTWFSYLESQGIHYLKLDLLNIQSYLPLHVASVFTGGGAWVVQTDKRTCWRSIWSLKNQKQPQRRIWAVEYLESENLPVIVDFPDIETAFQDLEIALVEAQNLSKKYSFDWEKWFADALELLKTSSPIPPYYSDLLPPSYDNAKGRQLLAGALKGWVFGGMGSWNDMYFRETSQENEYQRISKSLSKAVIHSICTVANSTSSYHLVERVIS